MAEIYSTQICRYDGKNCFVEAVTTAFQIGKVLFNFSQYDPNTNHEQMRLEIYLDFSDALALCRMISNNRLMMLMCNAAREGMFDGKEVTPYTSYFTIMGGSSINKKYNKIRFDKAKSMFPGLIEANGELIINKQFKVQRSNKNFIMLRGEYANGEKMNNGLIAPKGKSIAGVSISLSEVQAIGMAEQIRIAIESYKSQFYSRFSEQLFPNQSCKIFQYGKDERSNPIESKGEEKRMNITICSDLMELNSELLYLRALYNGKEFILYVPKNRLNRSDLINGNTVWVEYEIIENNGKNRCCLVA